MADTLPVNFPVPQEPALVNYDFQDYISSTGWVQMYGFKDEADAYKLLTFPVGSKSITTSFNGAGGSGLQGESNFNYEFLIPQLVKGELYVTVSYFVVAGATQTATGYIKCRIIHYDGVTETEIGTQQTADTINETADTTVTSNRTTFTFDVNRFFKASETLRVEIEYWLDSSTNTSIGIGHDGENRDLGDSNAIPNRSDFIVYVPFDLRGKI